MGSKTRNKTNQEANFSMLPLFPSWKEHPQHRWYNLQDKDYFTPVQPVLSALFRAKLLAYLSRFCSVSFCLSYHRYYLDTLGLSTQEVQNLLNVPLPRSITQLEDERQLLNCAKVNSWKLEKIETSLFRCAIFMFFNPSQGQSCRRWIDNCLGEYFSRQLIDFLSYIKYCHQWIESYSQLFPNQFQWPSLFLNHILAENENLEQFFPVFPANKSQKAIGSEIKLENCQVFPNNLSQFTAEDYINYISDPVWIINPENQQIIWSNQAFAEKFGGKSSSKFLGKSWFNYFSLDQIQQLREQDQQVLRSGQTLQTQSAFSVNSNSYHFDLVKIPLKDSQGQVKGILNIVHDITELVTRQQKLSEQVNQLEISNRDLELFSYSVSHDLQAPLRVIDGFSQVLGKNYGDKLDEKAKHYLQRIRANCQRMGELIEGLLQLSRVIRNPIHLQTVNLSAIAEEIATELQTTTPERQVQFKIEPNLMVNGDSNLLRNVLQNLLQNAWKYTSHHPTACIEFGCTKQSDGSCTYFVQDDGAGFEMTGVDKLFAVFQRLHSEQEFPGHGIGLATVKRIIQRHGGQIWAEGAIEKGSTFYFQLS